MAVNLRMCLDCRIRTRCEEKDAWRAENGYSKISPTSSVCYHDRAKADLQVPWTFPTSSSSSSPAPRPVKKAAAKQLSLFG